MNDQPPNDTERLRELLGRVVPTGPDSTQRSDAVAARGRRDRRRRGAAGAVAVAAAVAAVVVGPQLLTNPMADQATGPSDEVAQTTGPRKQVVDPLATTPCPAEPVDVGTAEADGATVTSIGPDAESIRLCPAVVEGGRPTPGWAPPADALVLSLSSLFLTEVARLPAADPHRCDAIRPASDPYVLLVAYPGRRTESALVTSMCSDLTVDDKAVAAPEVLATFQGALGRQRVASGAGPVGDGAARVECPENARPGSDPAGALTRGPRPTEQTRFAGFVTCVGDGQADAAAVELLNEQWPTSTRDLSTQAPEDVDRCPYVDIDVPSAYGVTSWGDVLKFEFRGCGNYLVTGYAGSVSDSFGPQTVQFLPSEELADAIALVFDV